MIGLRRSGFPGCTRLAWAWSCSAGGLLFAATLGACDAIDEELLPRSFVVPDDDGAVSQADGARDLDGGKMPAEGGAILPDGAPQIADDCSDGVEFATCSRPNALTTCYDSTCVIVACTGEFVDCDGEPGNGCEATLTSIDNCALCGATCALPHAQTDCSTGSCEFVSCEPGFGNCDDSPDNGCETPLDTITDCGKCDNTCPALPNAAPGCNDGVCGVGECLGSFGDCDDTVAGCEQPLATLDHCAGCGLACDPADAVGDCSSGTCVVESCLGDRFDCNGVASDGCEATLDGVRHCGACGRTCSLAHAQALACDVGGAAARCTIDHACPPESGPCTPGDLRNGCESGFADCDDDPDNGCERRIDTLLDCGACGQACSEPNAIMQCNAGACEFVGCEPGYDRCDGSTSCDPLAADPNNCGQCGNVCPAGAPNCFGGRCTSANCVPGRADCDPNVAGCESDLGAPESCGLCGTQCGPYAHARAACDAGTCRIDQCDAGFDNCDGVRQNGCEVDIHSLDACGSCTASCNVPFAQESCADGSCEVVACDPGRADCNQMLSDGCETDVSLPANCGQCGNDCMAGAHVRNGGCADGMCQIACDPGYGDCDGVVSNGCEANLQGEQTCGSCGNDCSALPHVVSAGCDMGLCGDLVCEDGYADCDGVTSNGCERSIRTLNDCGACGRPCALPHATETCGTGQCVVDSCDPGYADCNTTASDGCEASLTEPSSCGSCGNVCLDGRPCENGQCVCADASHCAAGLDCCDGSCVDTRSVCSLWPCPLPSTARPLLHCGGCGAFCPLVAAYFCCATL